MKLSGLVRAELIRVYFSACNHTVALLKYLDCCNSTPKRVFFCYVEIIPVSLFEGVFCVIKLEMLLYPCKVYGAVGVVLSPILWSRPNFPVSSTDSGLITLAWSLDGKTSTIGVETVMKAVLVDFYSNRWVPSVWLPENSWFSGRTRGLLNSTKFLLGKWCRGCWQVSTWQASLFSLVEVCLNIESLTWYVFLWLRIGESRGDIFSILQWSTRCITHRFLEPRTLSINSGLSFSKFFPFWSLWMSSSR